MPILEDLTRQLEALRGQRADLPTRLQAAAQRAMSETRFQAEFVKALAEREALSTRITQLEQQLAAAQAAQAEADRARLLADVERDWRAWARRYTDYTTKHNRVIQDLNRAQAALYRAQEARDGREVERARARLTDCLEADKAMRQTGNEILGELPTIKDHAWQCGVVDLEKTWPTKQPEPSAPQWVPGFRFLGDDREP